MEKDSIYKVIIMVLSIFIVVSVISTSIKNNSYVGNVVDSLVNTAGKNILATSRSSSSSSSRSSSSSSPSNPPCPSEENPIEDPFTEFEDDTNEMISYIPDSGLRQRVSDIHQCMVNNNFGCYIAKKHSESGELSTFEIQLIVGAVYSGLLSAISYGQYYDEATLLEKKLLSRELTKLEKELKDAFPDCF